MVVAGYKIILWTQPILSYPIYYDQTHQITYIVIAIFPYIDSCNFTFSFYKYCHIVIGCSILISTLLILIELFATDGIVLRCIILVTLSMCLIYFSHISPPSASFILCIIVICGAAIHHLSLFSHSPGPTAFLWYNTLFPLCRLLKIAVRIPILGRRERGLTTEIWKTKKSKRMQSISSAIIWWRCRAMSQVKVWVICRCEERKMTIFINCSFYYPYSSYPLF